MTSLKGDTEIDRSLFSHWDVTCTANKLKIYRMLDFRIRNAFVVVF